MDLIVEKIAANTGTPGHRKYNEQVDIYLFSWYELDKLCYDIKIKII
jgi:hypothetical protein